MFFYEKLAKVAGIPLLLIFFCSSHLAARTVTDLQNRTEIIPDKIERIVALRSSLSMVCYLGLADRVVGVEHHEITDSSWVGSRGRSYRMANPNLGTLPIIGSRSKVQPEKILAVKPDVILLGSGGKRLAAQLKRQTGIPVVIVESGDLGGEKHRFYKSIQLLGEMCGVEQRSQAIVNKIEEQIAELAQRSKNIPPEKRKKVYIGGIQFKVAHGITGTSCNYPPFQMVHAENVVDKLVIEQKLIRGRFSIKRETLLSLDPDVIFISESGFSIVKEELEEVLYKDLMDRCDNQVYLLMPHYYGADPATVLSEAWFIGKTLYPTEFQDIEIENQADKLYEFFLGRPLYQEMADIFGGFVQLSEYSCNQ